MTRERSTILLYSAFFFPFFFPSSLALSSLASLHKRQTNNKQLLHYTSLYLRFSQSVSQSVVRRRRRCRCCYIDRSSKEERSGIQRRREFFLFILHSKEMGFLTAHEHGKSKVRLGRTWRDAHTNAHHFVEWEVCVRLISPEMEKAYTNGDNAGMTTTDTTRNMVRVMYGYFFGSAVLSSLNFHRVRCVCELTRFFFLSSSLSLSLS